MYRKASSRIRERNKVRRSVGLFLKIFVLSFILIGPILIMRADFLQVKDVEISGAETISAENIKKVGLDFISGQRLFLIPKSNILLLNEDNLANVLLSDFPRIEKVYINKKVNRNIEVKVLERSRTYIWCDSDNECFNMSKGGLVFEKLEDRDEKEKKIIFRGGINGDPIRQHFASEEKMQNYLKTIDIFKQAGFSVSSISLELSDKVVFDIKIGKVFLNPKEDMTLPVQNVILLIDDIKQAIASKDYGSVEIYIESGKVVQITERTIKKTASKVNGNGYNRFNSKK